ncbi:MAG: 2-oxoacid:acceptor oxidoreductase family protein [Dehalococcoidia bacterium]|nr:2-oxoacid:acceptor oxidoreductase family protein [Dehalococcoidia bacterium]MDD5494538.1 2-oxoacid:acceptor oxidoreductase family protein [Dehalococcoidia bacterium]
MNTEVTLSGFGGQGVLFIGKLLAEAAVTEGKEVSWLPYYGAEKRGGMCSCYVNIADDKVGSIFNTRPDVGVAMSPAAMEKLEPAVKTGGLLIVNESLVKTKSKRPDIKTVYIPILEVAGELGDESVANLVVLGSLIANTQIVTSSHIMGEINKMSSKDKRQLELNKAAFMKGCDFS